MKDRFVQAVNFHGHLGPYLILGLLAGELALKLLKAKKYFGLEVKVWGATEKPKSCLLDGLQLSTGATYGKGNIKKLEGKEIKMGFVNKQNYASLELKLKKSLVRKLNGIKGHGDSEGFAKELIVANPVSLFVF